MVCGIIGFVIGVYRDKLDIIVLVGSILQHLGYFLILYVLWMKVIQRPDNCRGYVYR